MSDYVTKTNVLSALARFKENTDELYETKADANEMKSEINQHDARIANLEQKAGDYSIVQYRGTNAVPTGKAKYGLVKKIVGKSRAWNQLVENGNFASTSGWGIINESSASASGNILTVVSSSSPVQLYKGIDVTAGHKYLYTCNIKTSSASSARAYLKNYIGNAVSTPANSWTTVSAIADSISLSEPVELNCVVAVDTNVTIQYRNFQLFDLTLIFGAGNEPSTVADALAQLPALGQYNAYDAGSLVDTVVSGVESRSRNLFNKATAVANERWNASGTASASSTTRSDAIKVIGNTTYYFKNVHGSNTMNCAFWFDSDMNFITSNYINGNSPISGTVTSPPNACYLGVNLPSASLDSCCINVSDSDNGTFTPFFTDTLSLSETVTLRSAGSVAEVLDVESGEKTNPLIEFDLGDLTYDTPNSDGRADSTALPSNVKAGPYSGSANAVCAKYLIGNWGDDRNTNGRLVIYQTVSVCDSAFIGKTGAEVKALLTGIKVLAERISPDEPSQLTPVPDNTIYTEGSGTIETIQTQTPVIDNCLDVGYLAV